MKKILFVLVMLPAILLAAPVDPSVAQQVANNFVNTAGDNAEGATQRAPRKAKRMVRQVKQMTQNQHFYIFNSEDGDGFVIVAADDIAHPILGYSNSGVIDIDNAPENFVWWLGEYNREIQWGQDKNMGQSEKIAQEWQMLLQNQIKTATPVVAPLLKTEWDQQAPYNNKCPIYSGSNRAATGCVATAVAQIMNYWQHPIKGTGSHSYTSATRGYQLSANFGNTTYDWANMLDKYSYYDSNLNYHQYSSTSAQKNAVATLMSDVGIAFEMNYAFDNTGQSGSNNVRAWYVMPQYFGYDQSLFPLSKDDHTIISWMGVLGNQLDNNRPILYQGMDANKQSGHSFVCDGYNSDMLFHFNWGWSGLANGYYSLQALIPVDTGTGAGGRDYSYEQVAFINIMPAQSEVKINNLELVSDLTIYKGSNKTQVDPLTTNINTFDTLSVTADIANVFCSSVFNGTLYAVLYVASTQEYVLVDSIENVRIPITNSVDELSANSRRFTFQHAGNVFIEDGTYAILIYYKEKNGDTRKLVGSDYFANSLFFISKYQFEAREGKYVIVANRDKTGDQNWHYMTSDLGTASTKRFQAVNTGVESIGAVPITEVEDKYIWTLEADGNGWKLKNGTQYVSWTSGNSTKLDATGKTLVLDVVNNMVQAHFYDGSAERYLALNANSNNNYFAFYTGTNQILNLFFLPYKEAAAPPPARDCKSVPYTETFASSQGDFSIINLTLPSGFTSIWNWDSQYGMVAKCIKGTTKYESESWLISPCVELPADETCYVSFSHAAKFFEDTKQMSMWISEDFDESNPDAAQWSRLVIPNYPSGANWNWYDSGDISLAEYSGSSVNIAFCYKSNTSYAPQWEIKNFAVKKNGSTAIDEVNASQLSATKILQDGKLFILRGGHVYDALGKLVK